MRPLALTLLLSISMPLSACSQDGFFSRLPDSARVPGNPGQGNGNGNGHGNGSDPGDPTEPGETGEWTEPEEPDFPCEDPYDPGCWEDPEDPGYWEEPCPPEDPDCFDEWDEWEEPCPPEDPGCFDEWEEPDPLDLCFDLTLHCVDLGLPMDTCLGLLDECIVVWLGEESPLP